MDNPATSDTKAASDVKTNKRHGSVLPPTLRQRDTAQYVADMVLELRNIAKAAELYAVTVPLEFAYYEAFSVANRVVPPAGEIERLRELSRAAGGG